MNLELQKTCNTLVRQNTGMFVELRADVVATVRRTAEVWEQDFGDPTNLHGQLHCTSVRGLVIQRRTEREKKFKAENPDSALAWESRHGQGMSAMIEDRHGTTLRVRKAPSEVIDEQDRLVVYPRPEQLAAAAAAEEAAGGQPDSVAESLPVQPTLGPEFDELTPVPTRYRWYVLWTLSKDALHVPNVFLAAVVDIDDPSKVVVLAATPLPQAVSQSDDDFAEYGPSAQEDSGPAPA
ncbi:hypothetical protein A5630_24895 [Mycolicibacterium mucogenicum]|uniref:Uncharacterized protein n=1 Tax=Mycolicibacterium mucogenicum TaxID=56689 RepID=A0A1A3GWE8_MYCMU|nr:hypothetical protein [Mycolicibacterium mucogenicum]OBJ40362.1 hypothetical protein A5630_24895 [Mycolicibacterium mucogenicum]